jgi:peptidyl-prolyl cis-trans isomerase B (cyclophilin B)
MSIYTPEYQPNGKETALITTTRGVIKVKLDGAGAPIHVGNFVELAQKGFYDGLRFHRLEPNFVIQGGCPNTRGLSSEEVLNAGPMQGLGTGNPGYSIKGEWLVNPRNTHNDGTLAMARSQHPDSAGSQFYFCLGAQSFLDANYTVFGDAADQESLDVIHALKKGDEIVSIEIENAE